MRQRSSSPVRVLATAIIAALLVGTACSADGPDAMAEVSEAPAVTEAPATPTTTEPSQEEDLASQEPDETGLDSEDSAEADTNAEATADSADSDGTDAEAAAGQADLGAFNDYAPSTDDATPLSFDPAVVIDTLDNGLTYYVRSNDSPSGRVSVRLVVNAGAVLDPADRQGVAYFLSHVLFRGTENYTGDELSEAMRGIGVELSPVSNSETTADETAIEFDFLIDDPDALDVALGVLAEFASAATIDPAEVEADRNTVLSEQLRADGSAGGHIGNFLDTVYFRGTPYEGVRLRGNEESIAAITAGDLRAFYERWYRPDNMAVIVVGDLSAAEMTDKVQQHFAPLTNPAESLPGQPERSAFTAQFADEPFVDVVTHPEYGFVSMSIDWQLPAWSPATVGEDRLRWMESIIREMLNTRLTRAHRAGLMAQFSEPYMSFWQQNRGLRFYGTNMRGPDLGQATTDFLSVVAGAAHFGFTDAEFDRAASEARTNLQAGLEQDATSPSGDLADDYALNFTRGESMEAEADRVARLSALLDEFSAAELTAHLRWLVDNAAPLVVSLGNTPGEVPDVAALKAAVEAVTPVVPPPPDEPIETLMAAPDPVLPVRERAIGLFDGAYEWVFANGATVVFVPSDLAAGQVDLSARSLGGWSQLPIGGAAMRRSIVGAVGSSGVGDHSATQLDGYLAQTTVSLSTYLDELHEGFNGSASPTDLNDLFALMHLRITEPRVDEFAALAERWNLQQRKANDDSNPFWTSYFDGLEIFDQNSAWHRYILTDDEIAAVTAESLLDPYVARFGNVDDLMVVIVGDTDADTVADLAARYVGTLPAGPRDSFIDRHPGTAPGVGRVTTPVDPDAGDSGLEMLIGASVPVTAETLVASDLIVTILRDLLAPDGVSISVTSHIEVGRWQYLFGADGPSEDLERINATIVETIAALTADGPDEAHLDLEKAVLNGHYALDHNREMIDSLLRRPHLDDALVGTPDQLLAILDRISAADVQRYASLLLNVDNRVEIFRSSQ